MRRRGLLVISGVEGLDDEGMVAIGQLARIDGNLHLAHVLAGGGLPPVAPIHVLFVVEDANRRRAVVGENGELLDAALISRGLYEDRTYTSHLSAGKQTGVPDRDGWRRRVLYRHLCAIYVHAGCEEVRVGR